MGKTKRDMLKREVAQALHDLDRAGQNLHTLYTHFAPVHPEYGLYLQVIAESIQVTYEMLLKFWDHAWGPHPETYDHYRH